MIGLRKGSYMSAHVLLNLLNSLEKKIRYIYLYHKKYIKYFIKQIADKIKQDTNLISLLMYHMMLQKAQT